MYASIYAPGTLEPGNIGFQGAGLAAWLAGWAGWEEE